MKCNYLMLAGDDVVEDVVCNLPAGHVGGHEWSPERDKPVFKNRMPAFPGARGTGYQEGMSLRDWFAGQAAAVLLTIPTTAKTLSPDERAASIAGASYFLADAMLREREK